jgi:hypothetical protein
VARLGSHWAAVRVELAFLKLMETDEYIWSPCICEELGSFGKNSIFVRTVPVLNDYDSIFAAANQQVQPQSRALCILPSHFSLPAGSSRRWYFDLHACVLLV